MSIVIDIQNVKGEKVGDYTIDDSCLELEKGAQAVHDAVVAFLAENRAGTASTKTRAEVSGGGKKPFKQKGGGRARAGSTRGPIWRHGGIAFGPKPRDFSVKLNSKVKKLALKRSFSERLQDKSVAVVDNLALADHKTKSIATVFKALKVDDGKLLVSVKDYDENLLRATGNMGMVCALKAASVNTYHVLNADKLLFTKDALDEFVKRLA
ncbi:MAG: 50S ribosomal protein L4 [Lentisphaerae bacterium ADurb.Bin242]|nr:MAG: 50S ribosomal protein L4 [Lentisphaerae bacterium ADurb.Bin242]